MLGPNRLIRVTTRRIAITDDSVMRFVTSATRRAAVIPRVELTERSTAMPFVKVTLHADLATGTRRGSASRRQQVTAVVVGEPSELFTGP